MTRDASSGANTSAFFDTVDDFGFYTEIVEEVPGIPRGPGTRIARTCAEWDGTDPVRILTRDGYRTPESSGQP